MTFRIASFSSVLLLAARALATQHGIPPAFTKGFDTPGQLQIQFSSTGAVTDGQDLTGLDTSVVPKFSLGGEWSDVEDDAAYIIVMIDPDVSGSPEVSNPQRLHYMRTGFKPGSDGATIATQDKPAVKYVGAEATMDANGVPSHRYVFLLYEQPENFQLKGVNPEKRDGFNIAKWREENGLQPAVAGIHFISTIGNGKYPAKPHPVKGKYPKEGEVAATTPCTTAPLEDSTPIADPGAGNGPAIISTVTVTEPCNCSASPSKPGEDIAVPTEDIPTPIIVPSGTNTATGPVTTHSVVVGGDAGLVYTPEWVDAAPGDKVVFDFLAKNHTVTQSTFDLPCVFKADGVRSGFRANPDSTPGLELFTYTVEDTKPRWFYCAQGNHCKMGMVFAINPGSKTKFATFKKTATGGVSGNSTSYNPSPTGPDAVFTGAASLDNVPRAALTGLLGVVGIALAVF